MNALDVKLIDHGNYYDFFIVGEDMESDDSFDSSLITCLLVDKRADANEVPVPQERRGWIGSIGQSYQLGSKLWLYSQTRLTNKDIQGIRGELIEATKHYIEDGLAKEITAEVSIDDDRVLFVVKIFRFNSKVDTRYFELWNNTGE